MKITVHLRQPLIPLIVAFLIGLQIMEPSHAWTILLTSLGGACIIAYLWTLSLGRNINLKRETHFGWEQVGGQIVERFTLSNHSLFPAFWVELIDQSTLPDYDATLTQSIGSGGIKQWNSVGECKRRGLFYLGGSQLNTGDPFGIFQVSISDPTRTSLMILPQTVELPPLQIAESGFQGDGRPRPNAPKQSISAANVREYLPGDSMNIIHWPTTARMKKVYVRLMESAPEGDWWIFLDLDRKAMLGEGWDSIEEQSVAVAASLANLGLSAHKSVGFIGNGAEVTYLPLKRGEGQRWELLHALAMAEPGPHELAELLEQMQSELSRHCNLIIITGSPKLDWLKSIQPLARRGIIPTIILFDPLTFGGSQSAAGAAATLRERGIMCHIIPHGMLQNPEKQTGLWKWRQTPTGQIIPVQIREQAIQPRRVK